MGQFLGPFLVAYFEVKYFSGPLGGRGRYFFIKGCFQGLSSVVYFRDSKRIFFMVCLVVGVVIRL